MAYSPIKRGISTPVVLTEFLNSMVWLISMTKRPRAGSSTRSIATISPCTALAARSASSVISGVSSHRLAFAPRAVLVIQCSEVR